jgi:hypothetical protein
MCLFNDDTAIKPPGIIATQGGDTPYPSTEGKWNAQAMEYIHPKVDSNSLKLRNRIDVPWESCSVNPPMTEKNLCVIVQLFSLYLSEMHHALNH